MIGEPYMLGWIRLGSSTHRHVGVPGHSTSGLMHGIERVSEKASPEVALVDHAQLMLEVVAHHLYQIRSEAGSPEPCGMHSTVADGQPLCQGHERSWRCHRQVPGFIPLWP